jgi:sec-independent protein translocase protein TatB
MFEISWSELLILGIVTLIFVGPKELPVFLRTLGRYAGSIRRQAAEFRAQFDEALREAELDSVKKEFETMQASVNAEVMKTTQSLETLDTTVAPPVTYTPPAAPVALDPALPMPPMPAPPRMEP